jgi:hypothetical protein
MTEDNIREQALRTMPYDEYLQTPEWVERREQAVGGETKGEAR